MAPRQEIEQSKKKLVTSFEIDYGSFGEVNNEKFWNESGKSQMKKRKYGPFKLFQYANKTDILLMIIGACCAVIQGSCYPILSIIFGQMTDSFIQLATQGLATSHQDNITDAVIPRILTNSLSKESSSRGNFNNSMVQYSHLYLLIAGIVLVNAFLQTFCWEWVAERQVHRLRKVFFSQVLRQDIQWFDQNEIGNLPVKLSDDLERVRNGIGCKFSLVIQYLSTFVSGIIIGFIVNWRLTFVIVLIGPILIIISSCIAKATAGSAAREQRKYAVAGSIAEEVIVNIRTVAAFCKESFEMKRYRRALDEGRKIAMQNYWVLACGVGSILFLMYLSYGFAFYYGAGLVVNGFCAPGSIFTVFLSVMAGAFSVGNALPFINCVSAAVGAASSIFNVIDRVPEIDSYSNKGFKPHSVNGCIELKKLSFKYPARPNVEVLHDVSIKIEPGKVVAFVGSSGAGKSTIVGLVLRFYDPSEGTITLDNIPLHQLNVHWLRNQIGVVSQDPILFSGTIAENIRYGRADVTQEEMEEAARIANAHYFISKLPEGYNTQVGERGSQLSGGQNQRIAISRALVRNPKILLLDEATSALDSLGESIVQEALEKAMRGRTTIIIAHRLSTVRNADRIYVIKDGYVAESGKHEELLSRKYLYYNLVLAQSLNKIIDETNVCEWNEKSHSDSRYYPSPSSSLTSSCNEFEESVFEFKEENLPDISVWQLVKFNSKEWLALSIGILMCAITGLTMPVFSVFYSQIFIIFTLPREQIMLQAAFWSKMFVFLAIISGIAMFSQTVCMTHAAEKLIMRMRSKAFNNILKQPVGWFDLESSSSGYLITRLARDAPLVKAASGLRVGHVITAIVTMVSGFAIALYFGWKLTLVLCFGAPFIAVATYQQNMILKKNQIRDFKLMETAGRIANECIQNIRTVQTLGNEKLFVDQYMESLELPLKEAKKYAFSFGCMFSLSQTIIYVMYAVAFRYGSYLIQKEEMSPENTYSVFFALSFCAASVGNTLSFLQDYSKAKLAARRMMQLINQKSEIDPAELYGTRPEMHGNILFKSVYFTYPSRVDVNVLKGLSFSLAAGKTLALVGESGSGKSTVVSLLERFYNPAAGLIEIEQQNIATINVKHLRRNIGIVTQTPILFDCSIKDNIAYGIISGEDNDTIIMQKVIAAAKSVNIHNFIVSLPLGYDTLVGEKGTQLSGGQKQRIAIARALIKNPRILLLDEATSALDPECEKIVQDTLDKARKGRTCIIIAHRLSTVQNADIIAVVHKGKITETGTHTELLRKKGYYYKLIERQHV